MTQIHRQIPGQRSQGCRPGFVYLHMTRRVDGRGLPTDGVEQGYVGRSRDVARRTAQHAGLMPQRTGELAEAPWFDLKVGETRILEQGVWTDAELDARERYWIAKLRPRYCDRDNPCPGKIRKIQARRQRDVRDVARGLKPRQWTKPRLADDRFERLTEAVLKSPRTWWTVAWLVLTGTFDSLLGAVGASGAPAVAVAAAGAGFTLWKVRAWARSRWPRRRL